MNWNTLIDQNDGSLILYFHDIISILNLRLFCLQIISLANQLDNDMKCHVQSQNTYSWPLKINIQLPLSLFIMKSPSGSKWYFNQCLMHFLSEMSMLFCNWIINSNIDMLLQWLLINIRNGNIMRTIKKQGNMKCNVIYFSFQNKIC